MKKIALGVTSKLVTLSMLSLIGMLVALVLFYVHVGAALKNERENAAKQMIEATVGVVKYFYQLEQDGVLSRQNAQKQATETIKSMRYDENNGYFWINDMDGVMIMHPIQSELVGTDLLNTTDNQGTYLFRLFIQKAAQGGGWVTYNWPKPSDNLGWYSKVSYVLPFTPWRWVVGTGLYLDDINREVGEKTLRLSLIIFSIYAVILFATLLFANRFMRQLGKMAIRDQLTSMYTRRYFSEVAPLYISYHDRHRKSELAAIFFDIDHFKRVNDSYGHKLGDRVLQRVGSTIMTTVRSTDVAIRYGGEEFVVIAQVPDRDRAVALAQRIRARCAELKFTHEKSDFSIKISAGLALRTSGESMESLIDRADKLLYKAKENGRDRLETDGTPTDVMEGLRQGESLELRQLR